MTKMINTSIQSKLNDTHPNYCFMSSAYWELTDTLMEGNQAIRCKGKEYLFQYLGESKKAYDVRLKRSYLEPAYKTTVGRHAGKPFSRPVKVEGDDDARINSIKYDANLEGQDLTSFSKNLFIDSENHGLGYVLVDMTRNDSDGTLQGDIDNNVRPKFIHIPATCLYNWYDEVINNKRQLTEIIYRDNNKRYRWTRDTWEVYEYETEEQSRDRITCLAQEDKKANSYCNDRMWYLVDEGENPLGYIPLVVNYFNRMNYMLAEPPLMELAQQNLKHWNEQSDQDSNLQYARAGANFAKGFKPDELKGIEWGNRKLIASQNPNADFNIIEYSGASSEAGFKSLDRLENQMQMTGLKPEMQNTVDSTATGIVVNESSANNDVKVWACVIEETLNKAYKIAYEWIGEDMPEDFEVNVYKDFSIAKGAEDMTLLNQMFQFGILSAETVIKEAQSRGLIDGKIDAEEETQKAQGSSLPFNNTGVR